MFHFYENGIPSINLREYNTVALKKAAELYKSPKSSPKESLRPSQEDSMTSMLSRVEDTVHKLFKGLMSKPTPKHISCTAILMPDKMIHDTDALECMSMFDSCTEDDINGQQIRKVTLVKNIENRTFLLYKESDIHKVSM